MSFRRVLTSLGTLKSSTQAKSFFSEKLASSHPTASVESLLTKKLTFSANCNTVLSLLQESKGALNKNTLLLGCFATVIASTAAYQLTDKQAEMKESGNKFAGRALGVAPLIADIIDTHKISHLESFEGVNFQNNDNHSLQLVFRGESVYGDDPDGKKLQQMMEEILTYGRHVAVFPHRPGPFGEEDTTPTGGNEVLNSREGVPGLWTNNLISMTASIERALKYAGTDGMLIIAAPKQMYNVNEGAIQKPDGRFYHSEEEMLTPSVRQDDIFAVIHIKNKKFASVQINDNFKKGSDINILGDKQLGDFLTGLDTR